MWCVCEHIRILNAEYVLKAKPTIICPTNLGKRDVNHTECSGTTNSSTAVYHGGTHAGVEYPGTPHSQEVLQEDIRGLGYPEIRPLEVVKMEHRSCFLRLDREKERPQWYQPLEPLRDHSDH